jgi:hypothetical protein
MLSLMEQQLVVYWVDEIPSFDWIAIVKQKTIELLAMMLLRYYIWCD